jgi:hypothetical protein
LRRSFGRSAEERIYGENDRALSHDTQTENRKIEPQRTRRKHSAAGLASCETLIFFFVSFVFFVVQSFDS